MTARPNAADNMAPQFDRQEEIIVWHRVADEMPDADTTVLLWGPDYSEVLVGVYDETDDPPCWRDSEGFACDFEITHWADMPGGPVGAEREE